MAVFSFTVVPSTTRSEFARLPVIPFVVIFTVPPPLMVKVVPFFERPPVRVSVPPPVLMVALVAALMGPANVLVPVLCSAPPLLIPVPFKVNGSAVE